MRPSVSRRIAVLALWSLFFPLSHAHAQTTPAPLVWPFECEAFRWLPGATLSTVATADTSVGSVDVSPAAAGGAGALASNLTSLAVTANQADAGYCDNLCDIEPSCQTQSVVSNASITPFDGAPNFTVAFKYDVLEVDALTTPGACIGVPPPPPPIPSFHLPAAFAESELYAPFELTVEAWVELNVSGSKACGCDFPFPPADPCECFSARVVSGGAGAGSCPAGTPDCVELCGPGTASVLLPPGQYQLATDHRASSFDPALTPGACSGCSADGYWSCEDNLTVNLSVPARQATPVWLFDAPLPECPEDAPVGTTVIGTPVEDDQGNQLEVVCVATAHAGGEFAVNYHPADGGMSKVIGNCPFPGGINRGVIWHAGDFDQNGVPDRFIKSAYSSRNPVNEDIDEWRFLSCFPTDTQRALFFDYSVPTLLGASEQPLGPNFPAPLPVIPPGAPAMVGIRGADCDIDGDLDCDLDDETAFDLALGTCAGDFGFYPLADSNGDGCVTDDERPAIEVPALSRGTWLVLLPLLATAGILVRYRRNVSIN